jgi:SAM-dependent methyltransferase
MSTDSSIPARPEKSSSSRLSCRFCGSPVEQTLVDLGVSPLCERLLTAEQLDRVEPFYPLHVRTCGTCGLVQLPAFLSPDEIFTSDYPYYSAYSTSWVEHAKRYVEAIVARLGLDASSQVVEIASNDGYLLQHFLPYGIPVLGIEPALGVAAAAEERGVPTVTAFFGESFARELLADRGRADLVIANNVLAHVPDLNDFVAGIAALLAPGGMATFEFPHLQRLLDGVQYDTIYHEHFSYLGFGTVCRILEASGLATVDVEEIPTHGGSLRVFARLAPAESSAAVDELLLRERELRVDDPHTYARFAAAVEESRASLLELLLAARRDGKRVIGYGAPGKGNTLLNYTGVRKDLVEALVDTNPHKHGLFAPGTHLPIHPPELIDEVRPDLIVVLPWNLVDEISAQLAYTAEWGAKLVIAVPRAVVFDPGTRPAAPPGLLTPRGLGLGAGVAG